MNKYSLITVLFILGGLLSGLSANAQASGDWLENTMLTSGKINVVVAVVSVVFVLLVIYLISIDRKLSEMEKNEIKNS
ncbi:CcmD family protein [Cryomorpha ignava]|uniref:CcmD family protein n=1 Tax=Cryomorpha ignava TaxID=101383 RepID=A0A7K3WR09_9FLAO|nr:CcmD family protein [Cryomorpha ignava]NEN23956.1 CcmD family protein [Cryomorpha ignava]